MNSKLLNKAKIQNLNNIDSTETLSEAIRLMKEPTAEQKAKIQWEKQRYLEKRKSVIGEMSPIPHSAIWQLIHWLRVLIATDFYKDDHEIVSDIWNDLSNRLFDEYNYFKGIPEDPELFKDLIEVAENGTPDEKHSFWVDSFPVFFQRFYEAMRDRDMNNLRNYSYLLQALDLLTISF